MRDKVSREAGGGGRGGAGGSFPSYGGFVLVPGVSVLALRAIVAAVGPPPP